MVLSAESIAFVLLVAALFWWLKALSRIQCQKMFDSPDRPWRPVTEAEEEKEKTC